MKVCHPPGNMGCNLASWVVVSWSAGQVWPPPLLGWTFFAGYDSPDFNCEGVEAASSQMAGSPPQQTLENLLSKAEGAGGRGGCIAFNTQGYLKSKLRPQWAWRRVDPRHGLWVRDSHVERLGLEVARPPTGG